MIRRLGRYIALVVLLGVVAAISAITLATLHREADPAVAKLQAADRIIGYQVFPDRGPSFHLQGTRLKLVSNAVVDKYDPERVTSYGFRLTIRDGERELWHGDIYTQSRESKARWDGTRWKDEAAWGVGSIELTDERVMIVELPVQPVTATLTLTLLGAPHEALIRMFRDSFRSEAEREVAYRRLDASERNELMRSSTYIPWQLLSRQEQDERLTHRWVRMAALGDSGFDLTTRTIYVSDFRVPATTVFKEGIEIVRDHDIAINVHGPARLSLAAVTGSLSELEVTHVTAAGALRLSLDKRDGFDIDAEPGTLVIRTDRVEPMRFKIYGPQGVQIAPEDVRPPPGELGPDHVRIPLVVVGPNASVSLPVRNVARIPFLGRGVRIDARVVVADQRTAAEAALASLSVAYLAADGKKLRVDRVVVGNEAPPFERLGFANSYMRVTEPTSIRVVAPPGAVRLELSADRDVALRMYRWMPAADAIELPYRALPVPEFHWRYARLVERSWFPVYASNHNALMAAGRVALLDAQVRLEPVVPAEPRSGIDYQALAPEGHPEQQRAREPVPAEELADVLTTWPPGSVTKLPIGAERVINFRGASTSRPRLSWAMDPNAVASELVVFIDDSRIAVPIMTSANAVDLPRVAPGFHRVRVEGVARDIWIDRPPAEGGEGVARDRTLYRLVDNLTVRLAQSPWQSVHMYAIIYAASPAASTTTSFVMTIDGGRLARRSGVTDKLTAPELRATLPAARRTKPALLVDLDGHPAGLARSIGLGVLPDLVGGPHRVELRRLGGEEVWVRFVTTRPTPAAPAPTRTWSSASSSALQVLGD